MREHIGDPNAKQKDWLSFLSVKQQINKDDLPFMFFTYILLSFLFPAPFL